VDAPPTSLAQWLALVMRREGITTQGQVAVKIKSSPTTITNIFAGKPTSLDTLFKLSVAFHEDLEYLKKLADWSPVRQKRHAHRAKGSVIMVPVVWGRVAAESGDYAEAESWPYTLQDGEESHRFIGIVASGDCLDPRIRPGERLIVDKDASPRNDEVVVIEQDGKMLLKVWEQKNGTVWLTALRHHEPLAFDENVTFLGVVSLAARKP
jgi:hypothetical protein